MQSSSALLIGIERFIATASAPSAMIHFAFDLKSLFQQDLQQYPGIFHAMHHAVRVLAAIELGASPFHAGISRAFEKIDFVDPRQPLELIEGKDERLFNETVQH